MTAGTSVSAPCGGDPRGETGPDRHRAEHLDPDGAEARDGGGHHEPRQKDRLPGGVKRLLERALDLRARMPRLAIAGHEEQGVVDAQPEPQETAVFVT